MNDHVKTLEQARDKLINRRRSLAVALLRNPEEVDQFIRIQNAVSYSAGRWAGTGSNRKRNFNRGLGNFRGAKQGPQFYRAVGEG
jgi:hypothetical protein